MQQLQINKTYGNTITNHKWLINRDLRGGGNFITQSFPTNFHQFWTKKILTSSENIEDYKEVTSAEKTTIENKDKEWKEPSKELKAQAKAEDAVWNTATGYFELNGLVDITTEQMRAIMPYLVLGRLTGSYAHRFQKSQMRTITIYSEGDTVSPKDMTFAFYGSEVETIRIKATTHNYLVVSSINDIFRACNRIREVYGILNLKKIQSGTIVIATTGAAALKSIQLMSLNTSISFIAQPRLSLESITYMVDNAINTAPITITLHPDAYARLTDEIITAATAKQINFTTTT